MKKHLATIVAFSFLFSSCGFFGCDEEGFSPCDYVDMHIGTGGHGHVFMGASVPFGMVQLGPTSLPTTWDWCSGYHISDSTVIGFSHTHLSGTGIGDLFDITVMPVVGDVTYARGEESDPASGLWSYAARSSEIAEPGYYSVPLTRYGIQAELTATAHVGMHRYTFPKSSDAALVFDLENGGCWDETTAAFLYKDSDTKISGYRYSKGWAKQQRVYFMAEFSRPMTDFQLCGKDSMYARINFDMQEDQELLVKVALSPVSYYSAENNIREELPEWDFDACREQAHQLWNDELSKIHIETDNEDIKKIFYTSLFHTMIEPAIFCDVDGSYFTVAEPLLPRNAGPDGGYEGRAEGFKPYTILSLWDTYRAAMPLMSIVNPDRYRDVINGMLDICDKQGRLPVWHLWGNETDCMVGNPGIIAVADAVVKRTEGVDAERAMRAMLKTAADTARGGGLRMQYGFIPSDLFNESVAYDMEYAIADGAIATAANTLGMTAIADSFTHRSHSWRNYFCPVTHFVRGKLSDGTWREPFDPFSSSHRADDYCEGNAWQYTWLAPHDIDGLVACFGSKEAMIAKLDSLFIIDSAITGEEVSPDISGMIGQYAHGNEPGHHITYLYTILGEPRKTADRVHQTLNEMYSTDPDGLCGNEDAGQMSAWYILSALGFYEAVPASGQYWFGSPLIDRATIKVPGGEFIIKVKNNSANTRYIKSVTLNGKPYDKRYITHADIMAGGEFIIEKE